MNPHSSKTETIEWQILYRNHDFRISHWLLWSD